ncbi:nucleoside hydrolase-like [Diorhabda sublineata]|uniref:nucleoside hydrolase-like n=1 Tax=Diorhabda sublineata TaxID=1163346 RepID=UPI0024E1059A|nr:nucleoside hydrolase-like [Diorhabda sublineata]XP_056629570.1 nucleoside hydrolase-like [Diorhabda sublineata]
MDIRRIIIDVDVGTDDFLALIYLIHADNKNKVKIEGIICSHGNTELENVVVNVVRLLELLRRTDIPVYRGAKSQLLSTKVELHKKYHGEDGFADLKHEQVPDITIVDDKLGIIALHDTVSLFPNKISLICLGPLTTLALSLKLFDDLASKLKDVWIMGGNFTGVGNWTCSAEFNFYTDPEAAYIVLESLKCPIFIFPWETCLIPKIPLDWRFSTLGTSTPELKLLAKAEQIIYSMHDSEEWVPCDTFLVFCYMNPEKHINKFSLHYASVELHGTLTRGQVVLDHIKKFKPNVTIIEDIDAELFKQEMLELRSGDDNGNDDI